MEFKGTKGELELKFVSGVCIGIGTIGLCSQITANTILPETDEEYEKEREEIEANMKIYACAPEMLEIINEIIESIKNEDIIIKDNTDNDGFEARGFYFFNKLKKLSEKATTI